MNITLVNDNTLPELTLNGPELAENGFFPHTTILIKLHNNVLEVTPVEDQVQWRALLNSPNADEAADMMREDGSLHLAGDWLTMQDNQQIETITKPGRLTIRLTKEG